MRGKNQRIKRLGEERQYLFNMRIKVEMIRGKKSGHAWARRRGDEGDRKKDSREWSTERDSKEGGEKI